MRLVSCLILCLFAGSAFAAFPCSYSAERNLDIDPAGLHALVLKLGSSDLKARGVPGLARIEVRGKACASEESKLAALTIDQSRNGDRLTVTPNQASAQTFSVFGSNYAYIDLEVRVPATLPVEVKASSGDADIADIAALDFDSHSGDLIVHHVSSDVVVEVHSGDVKADDLGSLEVRRAGSGDVHARNVHGEVKVGHIGSGDLGFDDVAKSVRVESVGSGDITVNRAGGDVVIGSIGSGDVNVSDIGGDFTVQSAGSGDIHHHGVKGKISVPRRHEND
ncbi:MAG: DUF4097 family beta strand repeat-containing protein [Rudaea sp.]|nr:DUF4097 family beta strand repeat-containing protein [Rudaea sp.]